MTETMIRVPRMQAFPWQTARSTLTRSFQFSIALIISRRLALPVSRRLNLTVHGVGSQIDIAGPRYGALIDENAGEEVGFPQRRQRPCQIFRPKANTPAQPVSKTNEKARVRLGFDFDNVPIHLASTQDSGSIRAGGAF
jgi:hypothetical protein